MQSSFTTQRLQLDLITLDDDEFVFALLNTKGWLRFIGDRKVHSKQDALTYIGRIMNTKDLFYWVVKIKEENLPIGIISFLKRAYLEYFDIGFAFLPAYGGQGYAYEAARQVLGAVGSNPAYKRILATTLPSNERSIRLLIKLGLHFEKEIEAETERLLLYST